MTKSVLILDSDWMIGSNFCSLEVKLIILVLAKLLSQWLAVAQARPVVALITGGNTSACPHHCLHPGHHWHHVEHLRTRGRDESNWSMLGEICRSFQFLEESLQIRLDYWRLQNNRKITKLKCQRQFNQRYANNYCFYKQPVQAACLHQYKITACSRCLNH